MKPFNHYEGGLVNRTKQVVIKVTDLHRKRAKSAQQRSRSAKKAAALLRRLGW